VLIVTPITLLATLRMIEYFWQHERQSRNAVEIAERAGSLYDKLRGFMADMEKLGVQLDHCKDTYDKAINKLSHGRGNLISQAGKFPELGVKVKEEMAAGSID
jgi:DNA recombination protein RmuC